jgi:hypothetical protein
MASARSESASHLIRAFQLNLTALGLLALLVGTFLIDNTICFSVLRRRSQLGTLRAIGVTRSEIVALSWEKYMCLRVDCRSPSYHCNNLVITSRKAFTI